MISRHSCGANLPRHRHVDGYIAVVLTGGYVETGDSGRWCARPGTIIVHGAHEAHRDAFDLGTTAVLNLPLPYPMESGAGIVADVDAIARTAEKDPFAASVLATGQFRPVARQLADWPDILAAALTDDPDLILGDWADAMGLAPASVSRGFARVYGVSPQRYRLEARARRAIAPIVGSSATLADIAADQGFADQAHMTRTIGALTSMPPSGLRAKYVQAAGPARR